MLTLLWIILFAGLFLYVAYRRFSLLAATLTFTALLVVYTVFGAAGPIWKGFLWVLMASLWALNIKSVRQTFITKPFMLTYRRLLPSMSTTEKEALEAGTVWWDGEIFSGDPKWEKLISAKPAQLTD
jgi:acyl-CoA dehydrogenase